MSKYVLPLRLSACLAFFLFNYPIAKATGYSATYASKYGNKQGTYASKPVNKTTATLTAAKELAKGEAGLDAYYAESNFDFFCPGDSFIIGIESTFKKYDHDVDSENHSADRDFKFICGFMEDIQKRMIRKINCKTASMSPKNDEDNEEDNKKEVISCQGSSKFFDGLAGIRGVEGGIFRNNREYTSSCCELNDFDGKILQASSECKDFSFEAGKNFAMTCGPNQILKSMKAFRHGALKGDAFTFQCCNAAIVP